MFVSSHKRYDEFDLENDIDSDNKSRKKLHADEIQCVGWLKAPHNLDYKIQSTKTHAPKITPLIEQKTWNLTNQQFEVNIGFVEFFF